MAPMRTGRQAKSEGRAAARRRRVCAPVLRPFPTKQAQQVRRAVHLRHGRVRVLAQDLGVLRPLELVQQLGAQHHVEVLSNARHHFIDCVLPKGAERRDPSRHSPAAASVHAGNKLFSTDFFFYLYYCLKQLFICHCSVSMGLDQKSVQSEIGTRPSENV